MHAPAAQSKNAESAYFSKAVEAQLGAFFEKANRCYKAAMGAQRTSLQKAREAGEYLNKAKALVRSSGGAWLACLAQRFVGAEFSGGIRNAQNFMRIARHWDRLKPLLKRNPHLSIDAAIKFLCKPKKKKASRKNLLVETFLGRCRRVISRWPEKRLARLRDDQRFWEDVERVGRRRNKQLRQLIQASALPSNPAPVVNTHDKPNTSDDSAGIRIDRVAFLQDLEDVQAGLHDREYIEQSTCFVLLLLELERGAV